MRKQYRIVMKSVVVAMSFLMACRVSAGSLDPTNAPGPTMHTLEEIYQKQVDTDQKVGALVSPKMLSSTTTVVNAGYYAATNLTQVDADLLAANIKSNVTIFGVVGSLGAPAPVPKTGQTTSYQAGDDGDYENGADLPSPRFTIQANTNCVKDNLTGLVWARNANIGGGMTWSVAITSCETLNYGGFSDWRLPNRRELFSLIDDGQSGPALPSGHPFIEVMQGSYWSSSTYAAFTGNAWYVYMYYGFMNNDDKSRTGYSWPVRGGQ